MKYNRQNAQATVERAKGKAKPRRKADYVWINFANAVSETAKALSLPSEIAQAILFGLIATGEIRASDRTDLIDLDECTIAEIEGRAAFVVAGELMDWLRDHSSVPLPNRLDAVIAEMLRVGDKPGRNIHWEPFCDKVRDACNGWLSKGNISKHRPGRGFSTKQIQRRVKYLERL